MMWLLIAVAVVAVVWLAGGGAWLLGLFSTAYRKVGGVSSIVPTTDK